MFSIQLIPIPKHYSQTLTSPQVFSTFKKEVTAFFIRSVKGFEVFCNLNIDIFEQDYTEPSGFSKYKIGDASTKSLPYKIFQKYKNINSPAIFKVRLYAIPQVTEESLETVFDDFRSSDDNFYSYALGRVFDIGDGDDTGAVTIGQNSKGYYVDIWVRSFIE